MAPLAALASMGLLLNSRDRELHEYCGEIKRKRLHRSKSDGDGTKLKETSDHNLRFFPLFSS